MWKAQHVTIIASARSTSLHVPIGRPVVVMGSEDVIQLLHSGVSREGRRHPRTLQLDVVYGHQARVAITSSAPSYCGTEHPGMIGWITAMEPADYFLAGRRSGDDVARGCR